MVTTHALVRRERSARARACLAAIGAMALLAGATHANRAHAEAEAGLAAGPFAVLQAVLKKSFLKLEVARVQIRVDPDTQRKLATIAEGRKRTDALESGAVQAVMQSRNVLISSEVRRDVPFARYSEAVQSDLVAARESGMVTENAYWVIVRLVPDWLRPLRDRGLKKGDRFLCRIEGGSMRVTFRDTDGRTLVERSLENSEAARAVLAGYLAPDSSCRNELLGSLFR